MASSIKKNLDNTKLKLFFCYSFLISTKALNSIVLLLFRLHIFIFCFKFLENFADDNLQIRFKLKVNFISIGFLKANICNSFLQSPVLKKTQTLTIYKLN